MLKSHTSSLASIGHVLSSEGVKPDKMELKAISEMPAPTDRKGVMRLLVTVNYLSKVIPIYHKLLNQLDFYRQDIEFQWNYERETAFNHIQGNIDTCQ